MTTPGTMLREARESKGLSLNDMAAMTRIPKTMLSHLEHDRFDEYEAEVFVRGHIRNYARELRLDPEAILHTYERYTGRRFAPQKSEERKLMTLRTRAIELPEGGAVAAVARPAARTLPQIRPTHMAAVVLVLFALFVMVSFLTGNRATAKDPSSFPVVDESTWQIEQDVEQTRWLLEQPVQPGGDGAAERP
jgi:cytoskeleton protein RodZ